MPIRRLGKRFNLSQQPVVNMEGLQDHYWMLNFLVPSENRQQKQQKLHERLSMKHLPRFLEMGCPKDTLVSILKWSFMASMMWGYLHDFGNLHNPYMTPLSFSPRQERLGLQPGTRSSQANPEDQRSNGMSLGCHCGGCSMTW